MDGILLCDFVLSSRDVDSTQYHPTVYPSMVKHRCNALVENGKRRCKLRARHGEKCHIHAGEECCVCLNKRILVPLGVCTHSICQGCCNKLERRLCPMCRTPLADYDEEKDKETRNRILMRPYRGQGTYNVDLMTPVQIRMLAAVIVNGMFSDDPSAKERHRNTVARASDRKLKKFVRRTLAIVFPAE